MHFGVAVVSAQQVQVELIVRLHVAVRVHRHEPRMLQEPRVDLAARARIARRNGVDDLILEPRVGLGRGQAVHLRGRLARIDGPAHHDHAARLAGIVGRSHQGHGGQHRHGRLADGNDVHVRAQMANEVLHIADVVVQMERTGRQRHHAGVDPVGDIDVMGGQQRAHGVAQQRGVVAGQRGDQQNLRVVVASDADVALEVHQTAERLVQRHGFHDAGGLAVDLGGGQVPGGLLVLLADTRHQLVSGSHLARNRGVGERAVRAGEQLRTGIRECSERSQEGALHFVQLVQHFGEVLLGRACAPIIAPGTIDISNQPEESPAKSRIVLLKSDPSCVWHQFRAAIMPCGHTKWRIYALRRAVQRHQ
ncbi:hypothetical protein D3C86_647210 [compost metagenome]